MSRGIQQTVSGGEQSLPVGWEWTPVCEIGPVTDGDWILTQDYTQTGVRLLQVGDVGRGRFIGKSSRYISPDRARELGCTILEAGDILISRMPDPLGRACILPNLGYPCITAVDVSIWRPSGSKADRQFLVHYLCSSEWLLSALSKASGATRPRISRRNLERLRIPLPRLVEQKRIAAMLNEQMTEVEKAKVAVKAQLEAAKALPAAYLREVFESDEAESWPRVRLGDHVTKVGSGITPRGGQSVYVSTGVPLIRSQNVHLNRFEPSGLVFITEEQDAAMGNSRVIKGDVLLNITGASIGRVCSVPDSICPANVNQHVSIIRTDGSLLPAFLSYYLSNPSFQEFILETQAGATRQALTKKLIEDFMAPAPGKPEQQRIVDGIGAQMTRAEHLTSIAAGLLSDMKRLPGVLLGEVFGGTSNDS